MKSLLPCASPDLALIAVALTGSALLGTELEAQAPTQVTPNRWVVPAPATSGAQIHRVVAAELTDHDVDDLVYAGTDGLFVAAAPNVHTSRHQLVSSPVNDCATRRGDGTDTVWFVSSNGLQQLWLENGQPIVSTVETGLWSDAQRVCTGVGPVPGQGLSPVNATLGIDVTRTNALWRVDTTTHEIAFGTPVLDVALVDWNSDGVDEAAITSATSLEIYELQSGVPKRIAQVPISVQSAWLGRVTDPTGEYLAALSEDPLGNCNLLWLGGHNSVVGFLPLGQRSPSRFTVGDSNADGLSDIVFGTAPQRGFDVLLNTGNPATMFLNISGYATELLVDVHPTLANTQPCCADLDGDGDCEVGYAAEDQVTNEVAIVTLEANTPSDETPPQLVSGGWHAALSSGFALSFNFTTFQPNLSTELIAWPVVSSLGGNYVIDPTPEDRVVNAPNELDITVEFNDPSAIGYYCAIRQIEDDHAHPAQTFWVGWGAIALPTAALFTVSAPPTGGPNGGGANIEILPPVEEPQSQPTPPSSESSGG